MILKPCVTKDTQQIASVVQFNLGTGKYGYIISKRQDKSGLSPLEILTVEQIVWPNNK